MEIKNYVIERSLSKIDWTGRKVNRAHNGTISIKQGHFIFKNDQLIGGKVVIDVTTIKVSNVSDPLTNAQIAGHLASCDFFYAEHFPEASFDITSVSGSQISGNLAIKDHTHPLSFDAAISRKGDTVLASGKMSIDRSKYGMKFRSGSFFKDLGDRAICNHFDLHLTLSARLMLP